MDWTGFVSELDGVVPLIADPPPLKLSKMAVTFEPVMGF